MHADASERDVECGAVHREDGLAGQRPADSLGSSGGVGGSRAALDQQLTAWTVVEVNVEFRHECHSHSPAHGFVGGPGETEERNTKLQRCSGGGLHQFVVTGQHSVESAMGFDVVQLEPVLSEEGRQGSGLVEDDRFNLSGAEHHSTASETHNVREAGVRSDGYTVLCSEGHGPVHDVWIASVVSAGHVGYVDDAHEFFVVAELVEAQAFTHVRVQEHSPLRAGRGVGSHSGLHLCNPTQHCGTPILCISPNPMASTMVIALSSGILPPFLEASVRISDLVGDAELNIRLRVPGREDRLNRPISWCAPTEHMDPTPFLSVNALVLTNGMGLNVKDFRTWDAYVERLIAVPVSGLAFGLGAAHRELPAGLLQACEARGLPLLQLPPEVPFVLVMRHVEQIIATERYAELRKGWELADECTRLAADGHSLAEVLERVANAVDARVAVIDQNAFELVSAGAAHGGTARTTLRLPSGDSEQFRLAVEGIGSDIVLQPILGPVAAVIAMQLSYTLGSHSPLHSREAARFIETLYADRGEPLALLHRYALESGFDPDGYWGAVLIGSSEEVAPAKLRAIAWRARAGLQAGFSTVRFMEEAGLTTLLLQHRHGAADLLDETRGFFTDAPEFSVVVSESLSLSELPLALQLARRNVGPAGVHQAPLADLAGIVRGLPSPGLVAMCERLLAPLASDGGSALRETFDAYLRLSGNSAKICEELFIHRNTLSYRLRKIEELLKLDLSDGEVRATCLLALGIVAASQ